MRGGLVDAHCHLDAAELGDPEAALAAARAAGVDTVVMAGVDPANWAAQRALAARFPGAHPVFGIHPQLVAEVTRAEVDAMLAELAAELTRARPVALGELGLDRLTAARQAALELQHYAFRAQLALARAADLPVVLHLLRADAPALAILRGDGLPKAGGVVHSFSGSADFARQLVRLGLHVSFCGTLTLPQSRRLREAARAVPEERLLVETDSPDQLPWGARAATDEAPDRPVDEGPRRTNQPAYLPFVVAALAEARGASVEHVAAVTGLNARRLFQLRNPLDNGLPTT